MEQSRNIKLSVFSPECIQEFSDRVIAMIQSECELLEFLYNHPLCVQGNFSSNNEFMLYDNIKLKHDNDFCLVREMLREINDEKSLLIC